MIPTPEPPTHNPEIVPPGPSSAMSAMPATSKVRPKSRTTIRAAPNAPVIGGSLDGRRRVGAWCDDHRGPIRAAPPHRPRQLRAVEPHREHRVRAEQRRVGHEPVERLATGVLEEARVLGVPPRAWGAGFLGEAGVLVDLPAAEGSEACHQVPAETAAPDDEPEDHPLALDDAVTREVGSRDDDHACSS